MFGRYENYPRDIHNIAFFRHQNQVKSVQQAIFATFHSMNDENFSLCDTLPYIKQNCILSFEFGVADGYDFVFLDDLELDHCLKIIDENELQILDFFSIAKYHLIRKARKVPLRFDYHAFRFIFSEGGLEMQICHEKGIQHIPLDELTNFIIKQINAELLQKRLAPLYGWNLIK